MYSQDVHIENFASRDKSKGISALRVISIVLGVVFICLSFIPWLILVALFFFLLAWFMGQRDQVDFDYSYTNGSIDIARVFSKSSRKKFLSFDMKDVTVVAPRGSEYVAQYQGRGIKTYDCTSDKKDRPVYEVVFHNQKSSNAEEIVLMELEENFVDAMFDAAPHAVHK